MAITFSLGSASRIKSGALVKAVELVGMSANTVGFLALASGVNAQPFGHEEIARGAHNRALGARDAFPGSCGVGIESGVVRGTNDIINDIDSWFDVAMVVVVLPDGREFMRWSKFTEVPEDIFLEARSRGFEKNTVGEVVAEKLGGSAFDPHSTLTRGRISREKLLVDAIAAALAEARPFI